MNEHIDVIEALRRLDPLPPASIDKAQWPTAAEMRAEVRDREITVPTTVVADQHVGAGRRSWLKYAAAIAVVGSAIAAFLLLDHDDGSLRPATPVTEPATSVSQPTPTTEPTTSATVDNTAPGTVGQFPFAMTTPSADEEARATDESLYRDDFALTQVSAAGNFVSLRRCRDSASATCGTGVAYMTGVAAGGEVHGGLLGGASPVNLHLYLLDDRYFVALESAPGTQAPARAWLIDSVSGQAGPLSWRDEPTTLNSPDQALLLCDESYNSFATECAVTQVWDDTPFSATAGEISSGGTTVTQTSLVEGQYTDVPTEAGLPKVVDLRDGTIRPLAVPDNVVAALPVAQHGTDRIWIGTNPDGDRLGLAYSDDGGATWTEVTLPDPLPTTDEALANFVYDDKLEIAADGDRVAVASSWGGDDNAVYVSDDAGQSWTTATSEPGGNGVHLYVLADGRLVVMGSLDTSPSELLASNGSNWAELVKVDNVDRGAFEDSQRFSVNRAGIAMIRFLGLPCGGSYPCPGYTEDESQRWVLDTIDFSTDLTNWSTIELPKP